MIPARYASTRLPGKLLLDLNGRPVILHTVEQASKAELLDRVIVATDDERILRAVRDAGFEAVMTSPDHSSGSDRVAEIARNLPEGSLIVNVQGDEPLISPETIDRTIKALLDDPKADISTTFEPISGLRDLLNPNVVKVVGGENGYALYFSRWPMPFPRDAALRHGGDPNEAICNEPELMALFRKHTGLYAYRREYLLRFSSLPESRLERTERLEQLRALEDGARIRIVEAAARSIGIDTEADLIEARRVDAAKSVRVRPASLADVNGVARVHVETWRRSFENIAPVNYLEQLSVNKREAAFAKRLEEPDYRLLVAEDKAGSIVGFIDYGKPNDANFGFEGRIYAFYIHPDLQRAGIGGRLFRACLADLADKGYKSACLDTLEVSPFRTFYETAGGRVVARDKHDLGGEEFATLIYGWDNLR